MEPVTIWADGSEETISRDEFVRRLESGEIAFGTLVKVGSHRRFISVDEAEAVLKSTDAPPVLANGPARITNRQAIQSLLIFGAIIVTNGALLAWWLTPADRPEPITKEVGWFEEQEIAYRAATNYVRDEFAGPLTFSPSHMSPVKRVDGGLNVTLKVDGLNKFGGPVRRWVTVELRGSGADIWPVRILDKAAAARSIQ